ncbi:MAG TPA: bifunctional DNA-formamidopyrimidine glycosylase/DNA-(apurinic or apyrimidinic site) lyase [Verrucomicrobiae bacterium]|jgi:formamidopyrimidine-DNA glycosylase|nr:bifunctional DNA-formamidopyrimidine glycosylase/DNA-(apurinic or apyrimidinic site) lyase [Verrucomicrobiae bacterium]
MPELPEVEVLVRHLAPLVENRKIQSVDVRRERIVSPTTVKEFSRKLRDATFIQLSRRGKYLLFELRGRRGAPFLLIGHLGMTGRMYLLPVKIVLPKHAAVVLNLGPENFVFEDTRYFGRLTLDASAVEVLGPEPLGDDFTVEYFSRALQRSAQPVKIKLLDQSLVAGVGNIYASEALFRAGIAPQLPARRLKPEQVARLRQSIRDTLTEAIERGSTVPLSFSGDGNRDGLFYFGSAPGAPDFYEERLRVYDRAGKPCVTCGSPIKRIVQGARSTFYCPTCQKK